MLHNTVRRVTSADVAREAGLSRTTVSYVLNDTPNKPIPAETRQRVHDAAARLGYAPSAAARSLRSGRSDLVLCLLPDWPIGQHTNQMLGLLSVGFAEHGLTFVTHPRAGAVRPIIDIWKDITPAAVLAFSAISAVDEAAMRNAGTKVTTALAGGHPTKRHPDYRSSLWIGRLQVQHLAAIGHRRIGFAQTVDERLRYFSEPRVAGAREACADLGLAPPLEALVPADREAASNVVQQWQSHQVTAICAYNDDVALGVLLAMNALGLSAPKDLAVIGVDNAPHAPLANLTTIDTHNELRTQYLVQATVRALAGEPPPKRPDPARAELIRRETA